MNKIIIILSIICCLLTSCRKIQIIDITFNGETHQYIEIKNNYHYNLVHWEGCSCKKNTNLEK